MKQFAPIVEYPDAEHIFLDLRAIKLYAAQAKSPYVGIPVVTDGSRRAAVFPRRILQAAVSAPGHRKALYDGEAGTLTLNGGSSRYVLIDQTRRASLYQIQTIVEEIRRWAHRQQNSRAAKERNQIAGPMAPQARKTREAIQKLEKQVARLQSRIHRPANRMVLKDYEREPASESEREQWKHWLLGKSVRKQLSRFICAGTGKAGRTWAKFYLECGKVIGHEIDSSRWFPRVKARKRGPAWEGYWKSLPKELGLASKPWTRFARLTAEDMQTASEQRADYCASLREQRELAGQIVALKELLAVYERGLSVDVMR